MGLTCSGERPPLELDDYQPIIPPHDFKIARSKQTRFGQIQKIRTKKEGIYKIIMATNNANINTISLECRIMTSTADFELYEGTQLQILDLQRAPIIDCFDSGSINQVYHPVRTVDNKILLMKVYPFESFRDDVVKQAISQINLYQFLVNGPLFDWFIMSRGKANSVVMLFKEYETNLQEIIEYRRQANRLYTEWEIALIWRGLIANYKQLKNSGIVHRDIRLGKIFFNPKNKAQPYQLTNLESARRIRTQQTLDNQRGELLTVRGVDVVACDPVKEKIQAGESIAFYNPFSYDLSCLIQVLLAITHLDPFQKETRCLHPTLSKTIEELRKEEGKKVDFTSIDRWLSQILNEHQDEAAGGLVQDKVISKRLCELQLRRVYKPQIDYLYLQSLLAMHQKKQFNSYLLETMEENDKMEDHLGNIEILHRVGQYYQQIGLPKNEYYQEEINVLLELAKQFREQYFYQDHQWHLDRTRKLYDKTNSGQDEPRVKLQLETTYYFINRGDIDRANQQLSILLEATQRMRQADLVLQLQVLSVKILLEILNNKYETAENTMDKITLLLADQSKFPLMLHLKQAKAELQYLKTYHYLRLMESDSSLIKPKTIGFAEQSIQNVLSIRSNLSETTTNTIKIVEAYILQAELFALREQYSESRDSLERADVHLQNLKQQKSVVSSIIRQKVLGKLKEAYEKQNNMGELYASAVRRLKQVNQKKEETNSARYQRIRRRHKQQKIQKTFFLPNSQIIPEEEGSESEVEEMRRPPSEK